MNEESKKNPNFIVNYLDTHGKKIDSAFIQKYLGTGVTVEVFIYRSLQGKIYGKLYDELYNELSRKFPKLSKDEIEEKTEEEMKANEEVVEIKIEESIQEILGAKTYEELQEKLNVYNNGIEGQDVSNCDFSGLSPEQFEMLRFDENTNFEGATFPEGVNPDEILKRGNTQIQNKADNENMLHIAIIDTPIAESDNVPNLIVHNFENSREPQTDTHHGRSAYSIFSSVNPNCVVHFYGVGPEDGDRAEAVQAIIDYNNRCTDESKKIRLISCSHNLGEKEEKLITDGKLNVISAGNLHGDFFEYFRFDDKDVVPELTSTESDYIKDRYSDKAVAPIASKYLGRFKSFDDAILVNVNLAIDQHFKKIKRHECDISISWGVPVVAAYYAMALRANPNISYKEFRGICESSLKEGTRIFDETKFIENIRELEPKKTRYKLAERWKYVTGKKLGSQVVADMQDIEETDKESEEIARQERVISQTRDEQNIGE